MSDIITTTTAAAAKAREYARAMYGQNGYRQACAAADALERAAGAEQTNRVVISGAGRDCPPTEVVGIDAPTPHGARRSWLLCRAQGACGSALYALDGCKATVTRRGRWGYRHDPASWTSWCLPEQPGLQYRPVGPRDQLARDVGHCLMVRDASHPRPGRAPGRCCRFAAHDRHDAGTVPRGTSDYRPPTVGGQKRR